MVHQRLGVLSRELLVEVLDLHFHDRFMAKRLGVTEKENQQNEICAHFAANEEKSSSTTLETES